MKSSRFQRSRNQARYCRNSGRSSSMFTSDTRSARRKIRSDMSLSSIWNSATSSLSPTRMSLNRIGVASGVKKGVRVLPS
ncbi:hypothetical protein D3C76_1393440 [compost metagenome]